MDSLTRLQFQSTPRALTRGDDTGRANDPPHQSFNPRLALSREATDRHARADHRNQVSIHASRSHARRLRFNGSKVGTVWFQSTPRALTRGDPASMVTPPLATSFQSTPRALTRGDVIAAHLFDEINQFQSTP